jgi:creatinine amidohydrolase
MTPAAMSALRNCALRRGNSLGEALRTERPDLVREAIRSGLPDNAASLSVAIRSGKQSFEEAGGPDAYFGAPAAASAKEGRATVSSLGAILAEAVLTRLQERSPA